MQDLVAINSFVTSDLKIPSENIDTFLDRPSEEIQNCLNRHIIETNGAFKGKSRGFIFIYYSGHGCQADAETYGLDKSGKPFDLTQSIKKFLRIPNHFIIGVFECSRSKAIVPETKSIVSIELPSIDNSNGQACMIFGSKSGDPAVVKPNEISSMSASFLHHVKKSRSGGNSTFPLCLQDWDFMLTKGECVLWCNMQIDLFPKHH